MANWKLGQYVRIWKNEGYEYGHIETIEEEKSLRVWASNAGTDVLRYATQNSEVMLTGDDGKEIYTTVKQLEDAEE